VSGEARAYITELVTGIVRFVAYPALGAIAAWLLFIALVANLNFWGVFSVPLLLLWVGAGMVLAVLQNQRGLPAAYVFANFGLIAGTVIAVAFGIALYTIDPEASQHFPTPVVWLALDLSGLILGGILGPRIVEGMRGKLIPSLRKAIG
jgi:hypothetical protein